MTENGDGMPIVEPGHVLDAFIVAMIVFLSVLGGDALMALSGGDNILLTVDQVAKRLLTAGLAFGLTFFAQWARYRGIKIRNPIPLPTDTGKDDEE